MEIVYFKADKKHSKKVFNKWKKTRVVGNVKLTQMTEKYGSDGLYMSGNIINGYIKKGHLREAARGFNTEAKNDIESGKYTLFAPDKRFKEGKEFIELAEEYLNISSKNPIFSEYMVRELNIDRRMSGEHKHSTTGLAMYSSVAGFMGGHIVLKVPTDKDNPVPELENFKRIKKSEFIKITEEG